jgi:anti-sigma regulatory factor (Ser/Thr protein kinase)
MRGICEIRSSAPKRGQMTSKTELPHTAVPVSGFAKPRDHAGTGTASQRVSGLELAPLPTAIACARLHAILVLHEWGLRDLAGDTALIVSELMTNAMKASVALDGRPPITLRLLAKPGRLIIEAWDYSPLDVASTTPDEDAEYGRGLLIVEALSVRWGLERVGYTQKVVWAELNAS